MVSVYPSVTAATKGGTAAGNSQTGTSLPKSLSPQVLSETTFRKNGGVPNTMKGKTVYRKNGGVPNTRVLGRLPKRVAFRRGFVELLPDIAQALDKIDAWSDTWWQQQPMVPTMRRFPPHLWSRNQCSIDDEFGGASYWVESGSSGCGATLCGTCPKIPAGVDVSNAVSTSSQFVKGYALKLAGTRFQTGVTCLQNVTTCAYAGNEWYGRKTGAPVPTPLRGQNAIPLSRAAPLVSPIEVPLAWPISAPSAPPAYAPPLPGQEPSTPENKPQPQPEPHPSWARPGTVVTFPGGSVIVRPAPLVRSRPRPRPVAPPAHPLPDDVVVVPPVPSPFVAVPTLPAPLVVVFPGTVITPPAIGDVTDVGISRPPTYGVDRPPSPPPSNASGRKRPPKKQVIEHKVKLRFRTAIGIAWAGINSATEIFDFVVAMHDSIREDSGHKLSKKASKRQVLEYMFTNLEPWGHIDPAEGLQNYINMQVGDMVAAIGSQSIKRTNQNVHSLTGLDRAIREHGDLINEMAEPGSQFNPVPELDIDMETGVISISGPAGVWSMKL